MEGIVPERSPEGNGRQPRQEWWQLRRSSLAGGADGDTYNPNDHDVGWTQSLVGMVHTHPYDDPKVPEGFASFSEPDFVSFMSSDAHLSVLRSGPFTFMLSKTQQFQKLVEATNNDPDQLFEISQRMVEKFHQAFGRTKGSFSEQVEAGVMAVCEAFHLVYYEGQGNELTRKTKRPTT